MVFQGLWLFLMHFIFSSILKLIGDLKDYLEPAETDVLLIKSYYQALNSSILLPNTAPYKIAEHHYNTYKANVSQEQASNAK